VVVAARIEPTDDTIRVLFIEDEPAVAEMYKLKLELDGYAVTVLSPGEDVARAARTVKPELIFLDTQRHEDGGKAAVRSLRALAATRSVPVIILSNQHPRELAASGFTADVMEYVVHADLTLSSLSREVSDWAISASTGVPV
jgi:DNA-binding response OmpR family regulator